MTLEKGTIIYRVPRTLSSFKRLKIERVTNTQAIAKDGNCELRFDRDIQDRKWFYERGDHSYNRSSYVVENDDIQAQYERYVKEQAFAKIDVKALRSEQLDAILAIVNGM